MQRRQLRDVEDYGLIIESPYLTTSPTNFNLPAQQGNRTFSITSNCTDWNITSDQTWLTASPSSGSGNATISFNITENVGLQTRSGTLTISGCGQTQVINVSQAGANAILTASPPTSTSPPNRATGRSASPPTARTGTSPATKLG
ncbi:MAG: BACON domain-containing protein [Saprospiraceae bacterium]